MATSPSHKIVYTPLSLREMTRRMDCIRRTARQKFPLKGEMLKKVSEDPEYERRSKRKAAVLMPLCHTKGVASVLFTIHTSNVGSHKV